ncbi:PREDICTED: uncharacterized protein LOC105953574 [Erythranthe guttata]|uniref:uncharacterized protein LOC105953574 n=1 Tax=Erythranthe guttata TaxID=4155 RepID=UPI00064D8B81|nr:PREDICTED: uncharacterized protein LOC105953574 [Erythranthe guttata]|eukprot:XP_012832702.1 PREDICTED: uncharacterized protein LOC105953574 [Erythranthe guttata]
MMALSPFHTRDFNLQHQFYHHQTHNSEDKQSETSGALNMAGQERNRNEGGMNDLDGGNDGSPWSIELDKNTLILADLSSSPSLTGLMSCCGGDDASTSLAWV